MAGKAQEPSIRARQEKWNGGHVKRKTFEAMVRQQRQRTSPRHPLPPMDDYQPPELNMRYRSRNDVIVRCVSNAQPERYRGD